MLQYTEPIDNKSLFEIIRRTCNCVDPPANGSRTAGCVYRSTDLEKDRRK